MMENEMVGWHHTFYVNNKYSGFLPPYLSLFKSVSCKWKGKHTGFSKFKCLKLQTVRQLAAFITREISGALSKAIAMIKEIMSKLIQIRSVGQGLKIKTKIR